MFSHGQTAVAPSNARHHRKICRPGSRTLRGCARYTLAVSTHRFSQSYLIGRGWIDSCQLCRLGHSAWRGYFQLFFPSLATFISNTLSPPFYLIAWAYITLILRPVRHASILLAQPCVPFSTVFFAVRYQDASYFGRDSLRGMLGPVWRG
jgi:hypothetical protein